MDINATEFWQKLNANTFLPEIFTNKNTVYENSYIKQWNGSQRHTLPLILRNNDIEIFRPNIIEPLTRNRALQSDLFTQIRRGPVTQISFGSRTSNGFFCKAA